MQTIVTCPQCDTNFSLPVQALQPNGKRVKCTQCSHIWHQDPPAEDSSDETEAEDAFDVPPEEDQTEQGSYENISDQNEAETDETDFNDIPESVKPVGDDDIKFKTKPKKDSLSKDKLIGVAAALILLLLVIGLSIVLRPMLTQSSFTANAYYAALGRKPDLPAQNVTLSGFKAELEGETLTITGGIVNLSAQQQVLPTLLIVQYDEDGNHIQETQLPPPQSVIAPEEELQFATTQQAHENTKSVKIKFSLQSAEALDNMEIIEDAGEELHSDEHEAKSSPEQPHPTEDHHTSPAH